MLVGELLSVAMRGGGHKGVLGTILSYRRLQRISQNEAILRVIEKTILTQNSKKPGKSLKLITHENIVGENFNFLTSTSLSKIHPKLIFFTIFANHYF